MKRRIVGRTLWVKLLPLGLVKWFGMPEKWACIILAAIVACVVAKNFRDGRREQRWESEVDGYARRWEDLVWSNSRWLNPETPEQGVERLAGPFRAQTVPAGPFLPIPGRAS